MTPIILILACCHAGSILISSPNTLAPFVVSFADCYNELSPLPCHHPLIHASCIILLRISQFDHFSTSPLKSDGSQLYPMHMNHNGASKTLIRLIDGVYPISDLLHSKLLRRRQQSGRYSAPEPPTTTALPQNVPLSLLMRLVAPRVAAAALDGGRP